MSAGRSGRRATGRGRAARGAPVPGERVRAAEARLANARSELDRINRLRGAESRSEIDLAETAYRLQCPRGDRPVAAGEGGAPGRGRPGDARAEEG